MTDEIKNDNTGGTAASDAASETAAGTAAPQPEPSPQPQAQPEAEAQSAPTPTLTLDPFAQMPLEEPLQKAELAMQNASASGTQAPAPIDDSMLSDEEKAMVEKFATGINITDSNLVMQYGAATQQKMAEFSESALQNVRTKDLGAVGDMLTDVISELKESSSVDEAKGLAKLFRMGKNKILAQKDRFDKTEQNLDQITAGLQNHQVTLMKDSAMLDKLYALNLTYFKELTMYIIAGKKKLEECRSTTLVELTDKAKKSGLPEDAQAARDYESMCDRFDKKIHDLELTRMISIQTAPQIRLVQQNDTEMAEKIQSTIVNTIPLWKSQMTLALSIDHASEAAKAQHKVSEFTNDLLKSNAEQLKQASIATETESQRGIVDMETLAQTNQSLISTLDEVLRIQAEGRTRRASAEQELNRMESELKNKLLEIRNTTPNV